MKYLLLCLMLLCSREAWADTVGDVEMLLRQIRLGQTLPKFKWLKKLPPLDPGLDVWRGKLRNIEVVVESYTKSGKIFVCELKVPGGDRTKELLPAVTAVYGPPDPLKGVSYTWKKDHWYVAMTYWPQGKLTVVGVALSP